MNMKKVKQEIKQLKQQKEKLESQIEILKTQKKKLMVDVENDIIKELKPKLERKEVMFQ